jgi:hypothetical protein
MTVSTKQTVTGKCQKIPKNSRQLEAYRDKLTIIKYYQCPLKTIIRNQSDIDKIDDIVKRMNRITVHTYRFLKCLVLHHYHQTDQLLSIDTNLITNIMRVIGKTKGKARTESAIDTLNILNQFNDSVYSKLSGTINASAEGLTQMFLDQSKKVFTGLKNHIQEHFADIVRKYINILVDKRSLIEKYGAKTVCKKLNDIKTDILTGSSQTCPEYQYVVDHFQKTIQKDFVIDKSLESMASKADISLLLLMIRMSIDAEKQQLDRLSADDDQNLISTLNCFPLRTSIIPGYVEFDGAMIAINLMLDKSESREIRSSQTESNNRLWNMFFKMDNSIFRKKGYKFDHRLSTDGIGCSLQFVREDWANKSKFGRTRKGRKPKNFRMEKYVNQLTISERDEMRQLLKKGEHSFVGIDPGKQELIYCTNGEVEYIENPETGKIKRKAKTFTYTNGCRKSETRTVYFSNKHEREKLTRKVYGKSIKEQEQLLSSVNASSCIWKKVIAYMKLKNAVDRKLQRYYEEDHHRVRRWYLKINKKRSEANMLNRFEQIFGSPDEVIVLMGDWSENRPMRYQEPTMGKSIRRLFRNRGYKLLLVDEYNTSKRLTGSGEELVKFRKDKSGNYIHRVLTTALIKEHTECTFGTTSHPDQFTRDLIDSGYKPAIINRDLNGSMNIRLKGMHIFLGLDEPEYLSRKGKSRSKKAEKESIDAVIEIPKINKYSSLRSNVATNRRAKTRATKNARKPLKVIKTRKVVIHNKCGINRRGEHIRQPLE